MSVWIAYTANEISVHTKKKLESISQRVVVYFKLELHWEKLKEIEEEEILHS